MTRPVYERPILIRHQSGMMNKFSRVQAMRPLTHIDGVSVDELVATYGSPLFAFSEKTLVSKFRELRDAFTQRYPRVRIAWSYKTNYLDGICRVFHREGAYAEVVSEFELDKALHLGVPAEQVHFNGPYKPESALEKALPGGTTIHIDHFDELALAEEVAARHGIRPEVAIRLNLSAEAVPAWSRFGFNLESGQALDAVKRLVGGDRLELKGLHCHIGTFILDEGPYREAAAKISRFANELRERFDITLSFVDLGGGFASPNTLKGQYLPGDQVAPSFSRYAEGIVEGLSELDYSPQEMPTLVLETGRALVDEAGYLIASVHANKRLADGRRAVVLDAGVNSLFTSFWYNHEIVPAQEFRGVPEPTVIYGPLCMNIDVVRDTMLFPQLKVGERVVFRNVGAYNVTQWMQFITYRPSVVLIGPDGRHGLLRRPEQLQSIISHEEMPEWL
ncbi:MAG: alanine racemase [Deltaproteobacteria bacterium]|nr:alanine racemase [Deltaproteobacteria bacterium]